MQQLCIILSIALIHHQFAIKKLKVINKCYILTQKTQNKIPKHLGCSPKQSMHTGNAQASETINEKQIWPPQDPRSLLLCLWNLRYILRNESRIFFSEQHCYSRDTQYYLTSIHKQKCAKILSLSISIGQKA
jgi:hypothetical protein